MASLSSPDNDANEKEVPPEAKRFLVVGLEGAGKTTILHKLELGEIVTTCPSIGVPHISDGTAPQSGMLRMKPSSLRSGIILVNPF